MNFGATQPASQDIDEELTPLTATRADDSSPACTPRNRPPDSGCTGPDGAAADTNPEPTPATTADKPPQSHDHEMSLEY